MQGGRTSDRAVLRRRLRRAAILAMFMLGCWAAVSGAAVQVHADRWRWSNPLPHGNNVLDMLVTADLSVQVGDGGSIHVRGTDARWAPVDSGVTNYLRGTALFGNRILAVGEDGCIIWSDNDGVFQPAVLNPVTSDWFEGVDVSGRRALAVGDNGAVYTSTNGMDWIRVSSGTTEWLRSVACGPGACVAVGENGTVLYSINGTSWNLVDSGTAEHLNRVRYLGTGASARFVAVGNHGTMITSSTGDAPWTIQPTGTTNDLYDAAWNEDGLLLAGDQELRFQAAGTSGWVDQIEGISSNAAPAWIYLSAAAASNNWLVAGRSGLLAEGMAGNANDYFWNTLEDSSRAWIWDVTIQKGIYVTVGDLARIHTSLDGILWARETVPVSSTNTVFLGVGGTSNLLVAVGNEGRMLVSHAGLVTVAVTNVVDGSPVVTHLDVEGLGVVWTNIPPFTTNSLQGVAAVDGLFLACGDRGSVYASTNGTDWEARATPVTQFLSGIAIGPAACVAVGAGGTLLRAGPDGTGWSQIPLETDDWIYRVRWLVDAFVAVGQNGSIYTSSDGTIWTPRNSGTIRWLTDVTRVEDHWFITGYQGTLLAGTNLADWTRLPLPTVKSLFAAGSREGQLIVAGIEGVILRNQVVPRSSPVDFLSYIPTIVYNPDSTRTLYELILLGGHPDQFFTLQSATNLEDAVWTTLGELEMYDPSGTLYLLRSGDIMDAPPAEAYRTLSDP